LKQQGRGNLLMGIFNLFKKSNINSEVQRFNSTPNAVLLDVRTKEEYRGGHIPNSVNIPVEKLETASLDFNKDATIFVYCYSGARASRAVAILNRLGYMNAKNIGGIIDYTGEVVVR
jgi:phage shock protein E